MARYCFDRFCLDPDRKLLHRGDEPLHLTPRAFRLLEVLVARYPRAVSKQELLDEVWAGAIVEESNLKTVVLEIRQALEERGGSGDAIRTIFGFGYAFAAAVRIDEEPGTVPLVLLRWDDGVARLPEGTHAIGRSAKCAVIIDAPSVSREHAQLTVSRDAIVFMDLGSKNGTFVGESRIQAPVDLLDVCRIRVGDVTIELSRIGKETTTETLD